jgi:hypothetical protein
VKTIWKYTLPFAENEYGACSMSMPTDSKIISVQVQNNNICLWAEVNLDKEFEDRKIVSVGTGKYIPEGNLHFIGTVQREQFVWHIYEEVMKLPFEYEKYM